VSKKQNAKTTTDQNTHFDQAEIDALSYEQAIERLESIIDRIESGEIGLEQSVAAYEEGIALKKHCEKIQDRAEQRVRELSADDTDQPHDTDDNPED
jgi:exodeoxyribonuclease VII small subunit